MVTTIAVDKDIRDKAAQKAKTDRISVSAVVRILLLDYADGKIQIGTKMREEPKVETIEVDQETQNMMNTIISEWKKTKK
jgi:hypothetical protein